MATQEVGVGGPLMAALDVGMGENRSVLTGLTADARALAPSGARALAPEKKKVRRIWGWFSIAHRVPIGSRWL